MRNSDTRVTNLAEPEWSWKLHTLGQLAVMEDDGLTLCDAQAIPILALKYDHNYWAIRRRCDR